MANTATPKWIVPTGSPVTVDLTSTYGALLVGSWLAWAMWGVSSLQVFMYFMKSSNADPRLLKILIAALWVFDTTNGILIVKGQWSVLIHQYESTEGLKEVPLELMHHIWVETIVIVIVQLYFIRRIYIFSKQTFHSKMHKYTSLAFVATMVLLTCWELAVVFVYLINAYGKPLEAVSTPLMVGLNISYMSVSVAVDVAVSINMIYLLTRTGMPTIPKTKRVIYRIIIMIVLSGTLTAVIATIALVLVKFYPDALYYSIVEYSLCPLYFSTLLANLNARAYIQSPDGALTISAFSAVYRTGNNSTVIALRNSRNAASSSAATTGVGAIDIRDERDIMTDNPEVFPPLKVCVHV